MPPKKQATSTSPPRLIDRVKPDEVVPLDEIGGVLKSYHVVDADSIHAVDMALACGRPLLVRGEPGVGKSQLARVIAQKLGRVYMSVFVHARTEARDLLWTYDAISRLAKAQAWATLGKDKVPETELAEARFVRPAPLWWALAWDEAIEHLTGCVGLAKSELELPSKGQEEWASPSAGAVLLIDEIDKADSSVPNGLLESLGQGTFKVPGRPAVHASKDAPPLILLTTNAERALPDAFVRRCVVLHLSLPEAEPHESSGGRQSALVRWLVARGRAHHDGLQDPELLVTAARQVERDRYEVRDMPFSPPGLAEYIDLLAGALDRGEQGAPERLALLEPFVLSKHRDPRLRQRGDSQ